MLPNFSFAPLLRLAAAFVVLSLAQWASAQNRLPDSAEIDAYLAGVVRDTRIAGIVALVVDADRVVYTGAFGRQNVAAAVPMAADSIFRIASMTKPVTSVAVMMLVQEGDIGLDDPVSQYLPAFEDKQVIESFNAADKTYTTRPATTTMTVRHLLTRDKRRALDTRQSFESLERLDDVTTACLRVVISSTA